MKVNIEGMNLSIDSDKDDVDCLGFGDLLYVAVENAKRQLMDDISARIKREFLSDPEVVAYMERKRKEMVANIQDWG